MQFLWICIYEDVGSFFYQISFALLFILILISKYIQKKYVCLRPLPNKIYK